METKELYEMMGKKEPEMITDAERARVFPRSRMDFRPEGLDYEAPELFDYEGLSFEEMAEAISEDVIQMHCIAAIRSRFSEGYLELSRLLERGISELASCCVTKAAFEKQGVQFKGLKDLDLSRYYGIVSGHFRKCHAAITETTYNNQQFWRQMLDMEFRWYNLAKRLKATEDRINLIREGKISVDKMLEKLDYERMRERSSQPKPAEKKEPKALPASKAVSFPVMGDFLRDGLREKEAVPVKEAEPEPKVYATMKQRKKAERLARKHAAEQSRMPERRPEKPAERAVASAPRRGGSDGMKSIPYVPVTEELIPNLLSKGIPLPERV